MYQAILILTLPIDFKHNITTGPLYLTLLEKLHGCSVCIEFIRVRNTIYMYNTAHYKKTKYV